VGQAYAYRPAQAAFHMKAFITARVRSGDLAGNLE
jgi:hypothetical protein